MGRKITTTLTAAVAVLALVLAGAPLAGFGADHLDAPGLTSPEARGDVDINDLFIFGGTSVEGEDTTVLAVTVGPAAGALSPVSFGTDVLYQLKIDTDGDAVEDIAYRVKFGDVRANGTQRYVVKRAEGRMATMDRPSGLAVARGRTGQTVDNGNGLFFAGLRSDPFFFDLGGFLGSVEGATNGRSLNDGNESDPFATFNTLAIVLEVADEDLADSIGVWATTHINTADGWVQADRMGRPAINTVVNSSGPIVGAPSEAKNVYNAGEPKDDVADFTAAVIAALQAYSALDAEGPYSAAEAGALAGVLLPDVLTFDKSSGLPAPLNGRNLEDDVIDVELNIVTGGDPLGLFPGRDATGGITTDGIGPHTDLLTGFPYLGDPH